MKILTLDLDPQVTPYTLSKGIDIAVKKLVRTLKEDMLRSRGQLTSYTITLERADTNVSE